MRWMTIAAMALGVTAASPAWAQQMAQFSAGSTELELPLPKGFCLPQGSIAQAAEVLAAADKYNATLLTVVGCDDKDFEKDYFIIKAPRSQLDAEFDRPDFLKSIEPYFGKDADGSQFAGATDVAADALTDALGQRVKMNGSINPLGVDEMCGYLGGVMTMQAAGEEYTGVVAGCVTTVSRKPIIVYSAGHGDTPADVTRHAAFARTVAESIRPRAH